MKPTVFNYADHVALQEKCNSLESSVDSLEKTVAAMDRKNKALELANKRAYGDGFEDCEKEMGALVVNLSDERDALQKELTTLATESVERAKALERLEAEVMIAARVAEERDAYKEMVGGLRE